jgi:small conductance mechanosensitive channel
MDTLFEFSWSNAVRPMIRVAVVLILAAAAAALSRLLISRLRDLLTREDPASEHAKRITTGTRVMQSLVVGVVSGLTLLEIMAELGVNLAPFLAAAGIGGLAVGFGAQTLVKDLISGFFLLLENQVRVGDVVLIGGTGGLVESMGFRTLTLRDLYGNVHVIPNGSVERVTNMTRDYSRYVFDIGVSYREDPDEVMAVIGEVGDEILRDPEFAPDILEPLEMLGVDRFAESAMIIRCRITTKPIKQWRVGREFNRRLKKAFDARGIEIPFPHRTIYAGTPKGTPAPPLRVVLDQANEPVAPTAPLTASGEPLQAPVSP